MFKEKIYRLFKMKWMWIIILCQILLLCAKTTMSPVKFLGFLVNVLWKKIKLQSAAHSFETKYVLCINIKERYYTHPSPFGAYLQTCSIPSAHFHNTLKTTTRRSTPPQQLSYKPHPAILTFTQAMYKALSCSWLNYPRHAVHMDSNFTSACSSSKQSTKENQQPPPATLLYSSSPTPTEPSGLL